MNKILYITTKTAFVATSYLLSYALRINMGQILSRIYINYA